MWQLGAGRMSSKFGKQLSRTLDQWRRAARCARRARRRACRRPSRPWTPHPTQLIVGVACRCQGPLWSCFTPKKRDWANKRKTSLKRSLRFQVYEIFDDFLRRIHMDSLRVSEWLPSFFLPFVSLSHPTAPPPDPDSFHDSLYYNTGILDACVIVSCIAVMAVLRDITRIYLMEPFAKWKLTRDWERSQRSKINGSANGSSVPNGGPRHENTGYAPLVMSKRDSRRIHRSMLRFAEQGWSFIYYSVNFAFGVVSCPLINGVQASMSDIPSQYVHHHLPTRVLDPTELWLDYPHIPLAGTVKFYYLTQTAFYLHQVLILNAEARRKDHVQMMAHHAITIILMAASYAYNFTRFGCLVMVLMDCCDIFLPVSNPQHQVA